MNNAILERKKSQVDLLVGRIQEAKTIVAFDYPGLSVKDFTELRIELRKNGCDAQVYKNNIARRAVTEAGHPEMAEFFVGAKAIAFSTEDVIAPARVLYEFAKKFKTVSMQTGIIEGKTATVADLNALATLPSYETLLTQLAAGMLMPVRELAIGLNMIANPEEANQ
ncbi:MAG: 50S ribosomal protein L10 [Acholeplasma sp.]|jgi:large subunit ribosomal protein L10|nr:50S ribosomal protein L10 [Acholeplasma sp.]